MEIIFYVALWLLSGFLAAWIGHKVDNVENGSTHTSYREVFWITVCGTLSLCVLVAFVLFHSDVMSKPLFKAKEPK
jgi:dipeptide/tripeptide permease